MRGRIAVIAWSGFGAIAMMAACADADVESRAAVPPSIAATARRIVSGREVAPEGAAELAIESWQFNSRAVWIDGVIPAFEAEHPMIDATYLPDQAAEYRNALRDRFERDHASDMIGCQSFDMTVEFLTNGDIIPLNGIVNTEHIDHAGIDAFSNLMGDELGCLPLAAVMHGLYYNVDLFEELGLSEASTLDELFAQFETIANESDYIPISINGTSQGQFSETFMALFGPAVWGGEVARNALIAGESHIDDPEFVEGLRLVERVRPYAPDGVDLYDAVTARTLFADGDAVFYPGGSWEISALLEDSDFEIGVMGVPPAREGDRCQVLVQPDIGLAITAGSNVRDEATKMLEFAQTDEFRAAWEKHLTGFFWFDDRAKPSDAPLVRSFEELRDKCESSARVYSSYVSVQEPTLQRLLGEYGLMILRGEIDPAIAAQEIAVKHATWYTPPTE